MLRIIHFVNWAINRSGLFMCAAEQVKYERKHGINSEISIFETEFPKDNYIYEGIKAISWEQTKDADLFVMHRGIPAPLEELKKPTICVIHGTVEFLMLEEIFSHADKTPMNTHINMLKVYDACVTVNEHDRQIYALYEPENKLVLINDSIDTEKYTISGHQYPFTHHPQILWADSLRINKNPAAAIWAMDKVVKEIPEARLTVVGLDLLSILTWRNLILRSPKSHLARNLENVQLMTNDNLSYFRGADILVNGNMSGIPSRVSLEAMSCGCQVVGYSDSFTKWKCSFDIYDMADKIIECWKSIKNRKAEARLEARQYILDNHSMEKAVVEQYIPMYRKVLKLDK